MEHPHDPFLSRRGLLKGGLGLGGLLFLGGHPRPLSAADGPLDAAAFIDLSRTLTGHEGLDEEMGERLFAALDEAGAGPALDSLRQAVKVAGTDIDAIRVAADTHAEAARAVLRGWYVGLVRMPGGSDRLVGYEETLMGEVVSDFIPLRSNCGGEPHFWAEPPKLDDLPI